MHNAIVIAATYTTKRREILLDLIGIDFRNCGTSNDPGHRRAATGDILDIGSVPFERSSSDTEPPLER